MSKKKPSKKRTLYKTIGFRVQPSIKTNKWCVALFIDGQQQLIITPHYLKVDADYGAVRCRACLQAMGDQVFKQPLIAWKSSFLRLLNSDFDYPNDDEILEVWQGGIKLCGLEAQQAIAAATSKAVENGILRKR